MAQIYNLLMDILGYRRAGGIISQPDGDQGDSSQRTSLFYTLLFYLDQKLDDRMNPIDESFEEDLKQHETGHGIYRRSPDPLFWGFSPLNFSRDQMAMVRIALMTFSQYKRSWLVLWAQIKRLGFHQNLYRIGVEPSSYISVSKYFSNILDFVKCLNFTGLYQYLTKTENNPKIPDICSPMELSILIRSLLPSVAIYATVVPYLLITLLDVFKLFDNYLSTKDGDDYDHVAVIGIIASNKKCPTIFSKLAWKWYNKKRAKEQIRNYFSRQRNGIYPLGELYCMLIDRMA